MENLSCLSRRRVKHRHLTDRYRLPPFSGVMLAEYPEQTGTRIPHTHNEFQIIIQMSGAIRFTAGGEFVLHTGDVLLLPAGTRHDGSSYGENVPMRKIGSFREASRVLLMADAYQRPILANTQAFMVRHGGIINISWLDGHADAAPASLPDGSKVALSPRKKIFQNSDIKLAPWFKTE